MTIIPPFTCELATLLLICVYEGLDISRNAEIWVNNICGTNQGGFKVKKWFLLLSDPNGYEVKKIWRRVWELGTFNNFQKFQACGNSISAQISQKKIDRLKSADFGTLIYERTQITILWIIRDTSSREILEFFFTSFI